MRSRPGPGWAGRRQSVRAGGLPAFGRLVLPALRRGPRHTPGGESRGNTLNGWSARTRKNGTQAGHVDQQPAQPGHRPDMVSIPGRGPMPLSAAPFGRTAFVPGAAAARVLHRLGEVLADPAPHARVRARSDLDVAPGPTSRLGGAEAAHDVLGSLGQKAHGRVGSTRPGTEIDGIRVDHRGPVVPVASAGRRPDRGSGSRRDGGQCGTGYHEECDSRRRGYPPGPAAAEMLVHGKGAPMV